MQIPPIAWLISGGLLVIAVVGTARGLLSADASAPPLLAPAAAGLAAGQTARIAGGAEGVALAAAPLRVDPAPIPTPLPTLPEPVVRTGPVVLPAAPAPGLQPEPESRRIVGPPSLSLGTVQAILDRYHSPALPAAAEFYTAGQTYALDPAYALAWFAHESRAGTRGLGPVLKSLGNLRAAPGLPAQQGFLSYATWEEGIDDWFRRISTDYVQDRGLRTVAEIVAHYDGPDDPQDAPSITSDIETLVWSWQRAASGAGPLPTGPYPIPGPPPTAPIPTPPPDQRADVLPEAAEITTEFGHYPDGSPHYGLDIRASSGQPQVAPVGGVVKEVHRGCVTGDAACGRGWGNHIWWRSSVTGHYILLAHFQAIDAAVQVGATIHAGQVLGLTGMTGYATGPHVHVQVNPQGLADTGTIQPALEFPWLSCGSTRPLEDDWWGASTGCK